MWTYASLNYVNYLTNENIKNVHVNDTTHHSYMDPYSPCTIRDKLIL